MAREPDWESLDQMQFLLMRRLTEPLNAALAAVSLVHLETAADRPRAYWQERATGEVLGVLNLVNAWHALLRFKLGELLPAQHIRPFHVQDLLDRVSYQLELTVPLHAEENLMLESSREALQEALLLLYSAVYTLGPNVHLVVQNIENGVWFRVRYARTGKNCPDSLDELLNRLGGNWRSEDTAFELRTAADFITLSGSQLHLQGTEHFCEMAFFVYAVGKRPPEPLKSRAVTEPPPITVSAEEEILSSFAKASADDATRPLSEAQTIPLAEPTASVPQPTPAASPAASPTKAADDTQAPASADAAPSQEPPGAPVGVSIHPAETVAAAAGTTGQTASPVRSPAGETTALAGTQTPTATPDAFPVAVQPPSAHDDTPVTPPPEPSPAGQAVHSSESPPGITDRAEEAAPIEPAAPPAMGAPADGDTAASTGAPAQDDAAADASALPPTRAEETT